MSLFPLRITNSTGEQAVRTRVDLAEPVRRLGPLSR